DVSAARSEEPGIERLAQREAERARHGLRRQHDDLVLDQRAEAGAADDEIGVLLAARLAGREELVLNFSSRRVHRFHATLRATHARDTRRAFAESLHAARCVE